MTWIEIGAKQADMFSNNHFAYAELLVTGNASRLIMSYVYTTLCRNGKLKPLEGLELDQKYILWETAKEFSKDRLDKDQLIQLVKSLYAIEYFLNL